MAWPDRPAISKDEAEAKSYNDVLSVLDNGDTVPDRYSTHMDTD